MAYMMDDVVHPFVNSINQEAEHRRIQELLRYFRSSIEEENPAQQPQLSHDIILNAFAQLAAFRSKCQRSFISLIDHEHQYIIAECTRSMSFKSANIYEGDGDALLTGMTTLDLARSFCAPAVNVFSSAEGSGNHVAQHVKATRDYYIINDMSQLEEYKDRYYVANWPFLRYHVEVPIHSRKGLVIGTICAITDGAREGVDLKAVDALKEIASAVVNYLDLVSGRIQRGRAERMINSLGQLAEQDGDQGLRTRSSTQEADDDKTRGSTIHSKDGSTALFDTPDREVPLVDQSDNKRQPSNCIGVGEARMADALEGAWSSTEFESTPSSKQLSDSAQVPLSYIGKCATNHHTKRARTPLREELPMSGSTQKSNRRDSGVSANVNGTLDRATILIREALELNVLAFFDVRQAAPVQHVDSSLDKTNAGVKLGNKISSLSSPDRSVSSCKPDSPVSTDIYSRVLSSSIAKGTTAHINRLPQTLLRQLCDRFLSGGILNFNQFGKFQRGRELDILYTHLSPEPGGAQDHEPSNSPSRSFDGDDELLLAVHTLSDIFPDAKKILFFPLRSVDSSNRLFAYALGYTTDSSQVLQREDLAYITSFSNLLMVELARIHIADADLAKSRFISSISHELRSPLHGILASAELLKDAIADSSCLDIIETVESCGSTLLDTLDNLLSFAKINNFQTTKRGTPSAGLFPTGSGTNDIVKGLTSDVDMCALVEQVIDASIAGYHFGAGGMRADSPESLSAKPPVSVICNISSELMWVYSTQAGLWKRIVMNLVGNALKYTTEGYIVVKLHQKVLSKSNSSSPQMEVTLVVEDSGKGISKDYLEHDLYKPFHQEDALQSGTGLGLSIVKQLITSVNGSIGVSSEVGTGTTFTVTALLPISDNKRPLVRTYPFSTGFRGLKVGILGIGVLSDRKDSPTGIVGRQAKLGYALMSMLETGVKAVGAHVLTVTSIDSVDVDLLIATEEYFDSLDATTLHTRKVPLVLLSSNIFIDYRQPTTEGGLIVYMSQPFGPQRLSRALKSCLNYRHESTDSRRNIPTKDRLRPGAGHSSTIPIPLVLLGSAESTLRPNLKSSSATIPAQNKRPRILLVEDNAINLRLLVAYVKKLNCPYETATDGQKALEVYIISNGTFDIVFTDIQMPHKDGFAASLEMRLFEQKAGLKRTLIIANTGLASADAQEQASISGIDLLLTKPVPLRVLKEIVDDRFAENIVP